jgi:hypothetical protein
VAKFGESVARSDVSGPQLKFGGVDFYNGPTVAAGQVVVMDVDVAATVKAFTAIGHHDVHFATFDELF